MRILLVPNFQVEYASQLANALARYAEIVFPVWDGLQEQASDLVSQRVTVVTVPSPIKSASRKAWSEVEFAKLFAGGSFDVVHYQNAVGWRIPFALCNKIPINVLTIHDPFPHLGFSDPWSFVATSLHCAAVQGIVVHGRWQKAALFSRLRLSSKLVSVIPHGEFSFLGRQASLPESDRRTVLFIGRIARYKGIERFLESMSRVANRVPDVRFRIVGEGDLRPYRSISSGHPQLEVINRFVSRAEFVQEIGRSALVVVPYLQASQSGVAIAAQSLGRPVVVSQIGGLEEDVLPDETGLVVPAGDSAALADAIVTLLEDSTRCTAMGRRASEWMLKERSWDRIAALTIGLYEGLQ